MATNNNDKKISQLPLAGPLTGSELVPVVQNGSNKRVPLSSIASLVEGGIADPNTVTSVNGKPGPSVVLNASDVGAATTSQGAKADTSEQQSFKNQPLGYAGLDGSGKIPLSLLPTSALEFKGSWDANTNAPNLQNGTGTSGDMYIVSVAGTVDLGDGLITFEVGDSVVYGADGKYFRTFNSTSVLSVNAKTGAVVLNKTDIGLSNVDNTSDLNKPVSTATQTQLNLKANISSLSTVATTGSYNDLTNKPNLNLIQNNIEQIEDNITYLQEVINLLSSGKNVSIITREIPNGQINGINNTFTLTHTPIEGSEQVFLNGILQEEGGLGDYTIAGSVITFLKAPEAAWSIFVNYSFINNEDEGPPALDVLQWSATEQVYPFEKASDGSTLYCKEIQMGLLTCKGGVSSPHGISNYSPAKIHNISGTIYNTVGSDSVSLNSLAYGGNFCILDDTNINVFTPNADFTTYMCKVRLIYSK